MDGSSGFGCGLEFCVVEPHQRLCVFDVDESTYDIAVVLLVWWVIRILFTFRESVNE